LRRTATASAADDGAVDPSIYRRKPRSSLGKFQQVFRRGGFRPYTDEVDGSSKPAVAKRQSAPVFDEVFSYFSTHILLLVIKYYNMRILLLDLTYGCTVMTGVEMIVLHPTDPSWTFFHISELDSGWKKYEVQWLILLIERGHPAA